MREGKIAPFSESKESVNTTCVMPITRCLNEARKRIVKQEGKQIQKRKEEDKAEQSKVEQQPVL